MACVISISRDDLERDKAILFDARNLVIAVSRVMSSEFDGTLENESDELYFVIQSLARIAVEKIDKVTAGNVIDPLLTKEDLAEAAALMGERPNNTEAAP
jgi:hypothetical protein